ncbi:MAG: YceI-like domain [Planctomycetota bacterium]|jgi:polyisoprenoid-binding protein YceI
MRLLIACLAVLPLTAADRYAVDPAGSTVVFKCSTTWHDFEGTARVAAGTLLLDGPASAGAVEVTVASMDTANDGRTTKMRDEVLAGASFPAVRFALQRFEPAAGGGTAHGLWSMHGVTRPLAIPVTLGGGRGKATFTLDITQWDIEPPSVVVNSMSEQVTVVLDLALTAATGAAPARERGPAAAGVAVADSAGLAADLATLAGRVLVVYDEDGAKDAAAWAAALAPKLAQPPVGILRAKDLTARARTKALGRGPAGSRIDAADRVLAHLALPKRPVVVVAVGADGHVAAFSDRALTDAERDRIVGAK